MKKLFLGLLLSLPLLASQLSVSSGTISAHAKMMMDSNINPISNKLGGKVSIDNNDISSLYGTLSIPLGSFKSDKEDRDEHMYETLDIVKFAKASYTISIVVKDEQVPDTYTIKGKLNLHGIEKDLDAKGKITFENGELVLDAKADLMMEQFGIEMPCMVFMCVDEKVVLDIKATFK